MAGLRTHDNLDLHLYKAEITDPKANLIFVHGFFEHSGRYADEARFFNSADMNFYSYDQRSHGLSDGKLRSFIQDFDNYIQDFERFLEHIQQTADKPCFILCHSMGGLVVASAIIRNHQRFQHITGIIFSAPFLKTNDDTSPLLQKLAKPIGTLFPKLKVVALEPTDISTDPQEIEKYLADPLIYTDKMYAGSAWQMIKQIQAVQQHFQKIDLPLIILHGALDKIAAPAGSQELYDTCSSEDKTLIILKDQKHEILKDTDSQSTLSKISTWILDRI